MKTNNPSKKIKLIATDINFTQHSIVYSVKFLDNLNHSGVVVSDNNIKYKDLILKPTYIDKENMEVIFTPSNVTSHFYQAIIDKTIKGISEYDVEKNNIYAVGDTVGHVLI